MVARIAGMLSVSPSWIMIGHGDAPAGPRDLSFARPELTAIRAELQNLTDRLDRVLDALPEDDTPEHA